MRRSTFNLSHNAIVGPAPVKALAAMMNGYLTTIDLSYNCVNVTADPHFAYLYNCWNPRFGYTCVFSPADTCADSSLPGH